MKLPVDTVYREYADRIFAAAFSVCQNQADADDVVQDTLLNQPQSPFHSSAARTVSNDSPQDPWFRSDKTDLK